MSDELKVTKDAVLRAAEKCITAKGVLKEMFPEAFVPKEIIRGGTRFKVWGVEYVLGRIMVEGEWYYGLVSLEDGNEYSNSVRGINCKNAIRRSDLPILLGSAYPDEYEIIRRRI